MPDQSSESPCHLPSFAYHDTLCCLWKGHLLPFDHNVNVQTHVPSSLNLNECFQLWPTFSCQPIRKQVNNLELKSHFVRLAQLKQKMVVGSFEHLWAMLNVFTEQTDQEELPNLKRTPCQHCYRSVLTSYYYCIGLLSPVTSDCGLD